MISPGAFSCPACGASDQAFNAVSSLARRCSTRCNCCNRRIVSNVPFGKFLLMLFYVHAVLTLIALPMILGLLAGDWIMVIISFAVFILLVFPLAIRLHARNVKVDP